MQIFYKLRMLLALVAITCFLQNCDKKNNNGRTTFHDVTSRGYSHSVAVDEIGYKTVYISGQVPVDINGQLVGEDNLEAQTAQVFENIRLQLEQSGGSMDDVVSIDCFFTDISRIVEFRKARDKYINQEKPPASTAVEVERLINEKFLIEISAVAVISKD